MNVMPTIQTWNGSGVLLTLPEVPELDVVDVLLRALALRRQKLLGVLWAEEGRYWISVSEIDPYGSRVRVTLEKLFELILELEKRPASCMEFHGVSPSPKPPRCEGVDGSGPGRELLRIKHS